MTRISGANDDEKQQPGGPVLTVVDVAKRFEGLAALSDVSFGIKQGQIKALIGPNGAGKTTLLNIISGLLKPNRGHVYLDSADLTERRPHDIAALGVARTFQLIRLFTANDATVLDNVMMGAHLRLKPTVVHALLLRGYIRKKDAALEEEALQVLRFVGLDWASSHSPSALSFGNQRLVEMARSLMAQPKLLLLDEPASGLNDAEVESFASLLRAVREKGITVLLVEHNMKLVMEIADDIVVLDFGKKLAEGTPGEVCGNKEVIEAYLGQEYLDFCGAP